MPVLLTLIVSAAAGVIAVHFMKLNVSFWVAGAIGVLGGILGGISYRAMAVLMLGASSVGSLFVGGLIWIYRTYFVKR